MAKFDLDPTHMDETSDSEKPEPKTEDKDRSGRSAPSHPNPMRHLLLQRIITLFGDINKSVAQKTTERLLAFAAENAEPITIYISSPGGHVDSGVSIFDVIRYIKPTVRTIGTGWVGSIATHIYLAPDKESRFCLPNTRFLIHQPSSMFQGDASDIAISAREIVRTRERMNATIAEQTGQDMEKVERDTNRDMWMNAEESLEYGLVGQIISSVDDLPK